MAVFAPRSVWTNRARTDLLTADLPTMGDSLTTEIFRRHLFLGPPIPKHSPIERSKLGAGVMPSLPTVICRAVCLLPDTDSPNSQTRRQTAASPLTGSLDYFDQLSLYLPSGQWELLIDCRTQSDHGDIATVLTACFLIRQLETKGLGGTTTEKKLPIWHLKKPCWGVQIFDSQMNRGFRD